MTLDRTSICRKQPLSLSDPLWPRIDARLVGSLAIPPPALHFPAILARVRAEVAPALALAVLRPTLDAVADALGRRLRGERVAGAFRERRGAGCVEIRLLVDVCVIGAIGRGHVGRTLGKGVHWWTGDRRALGRVGIDDCRGRARLRLLLLLLLLPVGEVVFDSVVGLPGHCVLRRPTMSENRR